jgi:hypothetical protein
VKLLEQLSIHHRGWRPDDGVERTLLEADDGGQVHREIGVGAPSRSAGQLMGSAPSAQKGSTSTWRRR